MKKSILIIFAFYLFLLNSCNEKISNEQFNGEWKTIKFEVIDEKKVLSEAVIEGGRITALAMTFTFYEDSTYEQFLWKNKIQPVSMKHSGKFEINESKKLLYLHVDTCLAEKMDGSWIIVENKAPFKSSYKTQVYKIVKITKNEMVFSEKEIKNTELFYTFRKVPSPK